MLQNQGRGWIIILRGYTVAECSLIREQVIALSENAVYKSMLIDKNDKNADEIRDILQLITISAFGVFLYVLFSLL